MNSSTELTIKIALSKAKTFCWLFRSTEVKHAFIKRFVRNHSISVTKHQLRYVYLNLCIPSEFLVRFSTWRICWNFCLTQSLIISSTWGQKRKAAPFDFNFWIRSIDSNCCFFLRLLEDFFLLFLRLSCLPFFLLTVGDGKIQLAFEFWMRPLSFFLISPSFFLFCHSFSSLRFKDMNIHRLKPIQRWPTKPI